MKLINYTNPKTFLRDTQAALEINEAANSLMLGICGKLIEHPGLYKSKPCLISVCDKNGLSLAALMTPPHKLIVYGHHTHFKSRAVSLLVRELYQQGRKIPGVLGPSQTASNVAEEWAQYVGTDVQLERRQCVYSLQKVSNQEITSGRLRLAQEHDTDLVAGWWYAFQVDIFGSSSLQDARQAAGYRIRTGDLFLWEDEEVVSMAMKTRQTRNGISISMVYTPPGFRRRGYATACVSVLSQQLLDKGWQFCSLFADLANDTSNAIYQRIGYQPVCDYDEYIFV